MFKHVTYSVHIARVIDHDSLGCEMVQHPGEAPAGNDIIGPVMGLRFFPRTDYLSQETDN